VSNVKTSHISNHSSPFSMQSGDASSTEGDDSQPSTKKYLLLSNCRALRIPPNQEKSQLLHANVVVNVHTGKIESIDSISSSSPVSKRRKLNDKYNANDIFEYNCQGHVLAPGFIDIQINGALGVDFSSPRLTREQVVTVAQALPQFGVTGFCPTMVSCPKDVYKRNISILGALCQRDKIASTTRTGTRTPGTTEELPVRAQLLGIHLEGPFFCKSKRGAHAEECIIDTLENGALNQVYASSSRRSQHLGEEGVALVTLAPELPGALKAVQACRGQNVVVAMGHTNATLEEGKQAIEKGASLITHLFNAMRPFHHREPGLLGLISLNKNGSSNGSCQIDPYYSMIVDGLHSHPVSVKLAYTLSPDRAVLVTDAMAAMGLGDGKHSLGTMAVNIKGKRATISGTDTLAGSVVSMDTCVKSFREFCDCSMREAINAATLHPAKVLGLEAKGTIRIGNCADVVLLDDSLNVLRTWIGGKVAYDKIIKQHETQ
jgi:N-acetylglucosamine-6-phosphate deacetylase